MSAQNRIRPGGGPNKNLQKREKKWHFRLAFDRISHLLRTIGSTSQRYLHSKRYFRIRIGIVCVFGLVGVENCLLPLFPATPRSFFFFSHVYLTERQCLPV